MISKVLQNKTLVLLGEASYGMYILQEPISQIYYYRFAARTSWSDSAHFYVLIGLLIVVPILTLKWVENPARYWLREQGQKVFK